MAGVTPTPEDAGAISATVVAFVKKNYGVDLDYSVLSLQQVDAIIDKLRQSETFERAQGMLFAFGCYVGEVLVRHARGQWCTSDSVGMSKVSSLPIMIRMPDGLACNPVGKAFKRFENGPDDSVAYFYHVIVKAPLEKLKALKKE